MNSREKMRQVANVNTEQFNLLKAIEELAELQEVLVKYLTRRNPEKLVDEITSEIADVKVRILYLEDKFGEDTIKKKKELKLNRLYKNATNGRYNKK